MEHENKHFVSRMYWFHNFVQLHWSESVQFLGSRRNHNIVHHLVLVSSNPESFLLASYNRNLAWHFQSNLSWLNSSDEHYSESDIILCIEFKFFNFFDSTLSQWKRWSWFHYSKDDINEQPFDVRFGKHTLRIDAPTFSSVFCPEPNSLTYLQQYVNSYTAHYSNWYVHSSRCMRPLPNPSAVPKMRSDMLAPRTNNTFYIVNSVHVRNVRIPSCRMEPESVLHVANSDIFLFYIFVSALSARPSVRCWAVGSQITIDCLSVLCVCAQYVHTILHMNSYCAVRRHSTLKCAHKQTYKYAMLRGRTPRVSLRSSLLLRCMRLERGKQNVETRNAKKNIKWGNEHCRVHIFGSLRVRCWWPVARPRLAAGPDTHTHTRNDELREVQYGWWRRIHFPVRESKRYNGIDVAVSRRARASFGRACMHETCINPS